MHTSPLHSRLTWAKSLAEELGEKLIRENFIIREKLQKEKLQKKGTSGANFFMHKTGVYLYAGEVTLISWTVLLFKHSVREGEPGSK